MQKKKIINFRPMLFLAIALIIAIVFAIYVCVPKISKIVAFHILLITSVVFLLLFVIKKIKVFAFLTAICLAMSLPFLIIFEKVKTIENYVEKFDKTVTISEMIDTVNKNPSTGGLQITLDDVFVEKDGIIYDFNGKVKLFGNQDNLSSVDKLVCGKVVIVSTKLSFVSIEKDFSKSSSMLSKNILASGYVADFNLEITKSQSLNVRNRVHNYVLEKLENSNAKHYKIGYAMMFGDSSEIDYDVKSEFQATGIAHLLAVSGLHVSIIIGILSFILKKLKCPNIVNMCLMTLILGFYVYLCNASVSVIRASFMAFMSLYAIIRGKSYDKLSILSLIAVVILLVSPFELFNLSFILSFLAVLSIFLIAPALQRYFKILYPSKLSSMIAMNIAIQIGLMAVIVYYFGVYPVFGVFANFVAVPIATLSFVLLIFGIILSSIFPFMDFLLLIYGEIMQIAVSFNEWIAHSGIYLVFDKFSPFVIPLSIVIMFLASDYIFLSKKKKVVSIAIGAVVLSLLVLL